MLLNFLRSQKNNYIIRHFDKTRYGKRIRKMHNAFDGRCFIVANGPSLTPSDLDVLNENNEFSFGMNRIFKMFERTKWTPFFYVCEDINIFHGSIDQINSIDTKHKFIPINHLLFNNIRIKDAIYFYMNYDKSKDSFLSFSENIDKKIDAHGTVTFTCINIAVYLGFKEIYLLGVDHNYRVTINEDGNKVVDENVNDYFCDGYDDDIKDEVVHDMKRNTLAYNQAKEYCDIHGIKVFNATRGGKLEVFPRVDFDSLFEG